MTTSEIKLNYRIQCTVVYTIKYGLKLTTYVYPSGGK